MKEAEIQALWKIINSLCIKYSYKSKTSLFNKGKRLSIIRDDSWLRQTKNPNPNSTQPRPLSLQRQNLPYSEASNTFRVDNPLLSFKLESLQPIHQRANPFLPGVDRCKFMIYVGWVGPEYELEAGRIGDYARSEQLITGFSKHCRPWAEVGDERNGYPCRQPKPPSASFRERLHEHRGCAIGQSHPRSPRSSAFQSTGLGA